MVSFDCFFLFFFVFFRYQMSPNYLNRIFALQLLDKCSPNPTENSLIRSVAKCYTYQSIFTIDGAILCLRDTAAEKG